MSKAPQRNLKESQKEFQRILEDMSHGSYHLRDVFDDFLLKATVFLRQAVHKWRFHKFDEQMEEEMIAYLKPRYKRPNDFGAAFMVLADALGGEVHDFLGEFYGAIGATNDKTGQFFTPSALSEACAKMIFTREHYESTIAKGQRFSICEPCVGAGSMVIEAVKLLKEWEAHPSTYYIDATDIDLRCVRMSYIQLSLLGAPAIVRHGNTLSLEQWDAWPTMTLALNPFIPKRAEEQPTAPPSGQHGHSPNTSTNPRTEAQGRSPLGSTRALHLVRSASPATKLCLPASMPKSQFRKLSFGKGHRE